MGEYRSFSRGFEKLIYDWAISQYDRGINVTKLSLRQKANELGHDRGFKGSVRWCESFLKRNGDIKEIVYLNKYCQNKMKELHKNINNQNNSIEGDERWYPEKG